MLPPRPHGNPGQRVSSVNAVLGHYPGYVQNRIGAVRTHFDSDCAVVEAREDAAHFGNACVVVDVRGRLRLRLVLDRGVESLDIGPVPDAAPEGDGRLYPFEVVAAFLGLNGATVDKLVADHENYCRQLDIETDNGHGEAPLLPDPVGLLAGNWREFVQAIHFRRDELNATCRAVQDRVWNVLAGIAPPDNPNPDG